MAEIDIQRRPPIWPWIIGALALVVLAFIVVGLVRDDDPPREEAALQRPVEAPSERPADQGTDRSSTGTSGTVPRAVQEYSEFAAGQEDLSPGREHEYTAEGIRRLSAALAAHVEQHAGDAATQARFERFRTLADRLQANPRSGEHAGMVQDVFTSAVEVFESAQIAAGDVSGLRQTALSVSPDQSLLDQTSRVKQFFRQSAEALERAAMGGAQAQPS